MFIDSVYACIEKLLEFRLLFTYEYKNLVIPLILKRRKLKLKKAFTFKLPL